MFNAIKSPDGRLAVIDGGTKEHTEYVREILEEQGGNLMNESSLVFKLSNNDESILFCSDTGHTPRVDKIVSKYEKIRG